MTVYWNVASCILIEIGRRFGRAMAQAVSRWPLITEARVRDHVMPCGICGGQSSSGQVFPRQYQSTVVFHTHVNYGKNNRAVDGLSSETCHQYKQPTFRRQ
jgi:hypothetical protein